MEEQERQQRFMSLLNPILPAASGLAMVIVRNRADGEDVVQEASLKAYRAFDRYDPGRPFKAWFLTIVGNCARDLLRRRKTRARTGGTGATGGAAAGYSSSPDDSVLAVDPGAHLFKERVLLLNALSKLSPIHEEILQLRYFGEMTYKEMACALQIPEGTVMSRLYGARVALAALVRE